MSSWTSQLGAGHPGWLTVPLQVPAKAARPEGAGAEDGPGSAAFVAGDGACECCGGRPGEPAGTGPEPDVPAVVPSLDVGCALALRVGAFEPAAATACGPPCPPGESSLTGRDSRVMPAATAPTSTTSATAPPTRDFFDFPWPSWGAPPRGGGPGGPDMAAARRASCPPALGPASSGPPGTGTAADAGAARTRSPVFGIQGAEASALDHSGGARTSPDA